MSGLTPVNFNNEIVITTKTLAQVYECKEQQITQNFNYNQDKFEEKKHYYKLQGEELKEFKRVLENSDNPLYKEIKEEYEQTEEYKTSRKHSEIIRKYNKAKIKFEQKYNSMKFDRCYDVFLNLRNKDFLDQIKKEYKQQQQSYENYRSYYSDNYSNHNYNNYSSYQVNSKSNYNDEDKKILKKMYKKLAMEFHPDRNNNSEESQRAMQIINNLKDEWEV